MVTEIIIVNKYDIIPSIDIRMMINKLRYRLGKYNLIENGFTQQCPVILFNGKLSEKAIEECANLTNAHGYAFISYSMSKHLIRFNNKHY